MFPKDQEAGVMNIYICATYPIFIKPYADRWQREGHNVVMSQRFDPFIAQKADLLFAEWMDANAVQIQNFQTKAKKIMRIHRYEVYTDILKYMNWQKWDEIVFVNRYHQNYLQTRTKVPLKAKIIPNGIPIRDYEFNPCPDSNKVAYMGYISRKKGAGEIELIANTFKNYEFHIAGVFQELDVEDKMSKNPNLKFHGWVDKKSDFFKDIKYVINASLAESHGLAICEGMLCGCKPIIRDWNSSEFVYRKEWTWKDMQDIECLLAGKYEPEKYREFVESNYSFERAYKAMTELL